MIKGRRVKPHIYKIKMDQVEEALVTGFFKNFIKEDDLVKQRSSLEKFQSRNPVGSWYSSKVEDENVFIMKGDKPPTKGAKKLKNVDVPTTPPRKRVEFLNKLLSQIPPKLWTMFANDYLKQSKERYNAYLDKWIKMPSVKIEILGYEEEEEEPIENPDWKPEFDIPDTLPVDGEDDAKFEDFLKRYYKKKTKREESKPYSLLQEPDKCLNLYASYDWVGKKDVKIYITPLENEELDLTMYYNEDISIDIENVEFYEAKPSFFRLQCGKYKNDRFQDGNILTSYTDNGVEVSFYIAITYDNGYILQDEEIFENENIFFNSLIQTQVNAIQKISHEGFIHKVIRGFGKKKIGEALRKSNDQRPLEYGYSRLIIDKNGDSKLDEKNDTIFISTLENSLYENGHSSVNDYLNNIASFTLFFSDWVDQFGKSTFIQRVGAMYYTPDMLALFTLEDKLANVFSDPYITSEQKDEISKNVVLEQVEIVQDYLLDIFILLNPSQKLFYSLRRKVTTNPEWTRKRACENLNEVDSINNYELEIYLDKDGKYYCLRIPDLIDMFSNGIYINMYTRNKLSQSFIDEFKRKYSYLLKEEVKFNGGDLLKVIIGQIKQIEDMIADREVVIDQEKMCSYCDEHVSNSDSYKSVVFDKDGSHKIIEFCSINCMERTSGSDWPKLKSKRK